MTSSRRSPTRLPIHAYPINIPTMPTLTLHHYKDHKQPYIAQLVKDTTTGKIALRFIQKQQSKKLLPPTES